MAATKLNRADREMRLAEVARLYNRGYTMRQIAAKMGDPDHTQVAYDINKIKQRYQKIQQQEITAHREEISEQYRAIFEEMWECFRDSKTKQINVEKKITDADGKTYTFQELMEIAVNPDPRYMAIVQECLAGMRKLRGVDVAKDAAQVNIQQNNQTVAIDWNAPPAPVSNVDKRLEELEQMEDKPEYGLKELPNGKTIAE